MMDIIHIIKNLSSIIIIYIHPIIFELLLDQLEHTLLDLLPESNQNLKFKILVSI